MSPPTDAAVTYERILRLVGAQTGFSFEVGHRAAAEVGIARAMARAGLADMGRYHHRLLTDRDALDDLIVELAVGETYFFRQAGQFAFLARRVLPEIQRAKGNTETIRAWSAGCASGEEPYSLAILFHEQGLIERTHILATDISRAALAKARTGVYRQWSLRGDGAAAARRYLRPGPEGYVLDERIRRRVVFACLNLAVDLYPSIATGAWGMDVILCRNVLIYFDRETIGRVARRLHDALAPGGWLITAASDPLLAEHAPFQTVADEEGVFYRRGDAGAPALNPLHNAQQETEAQTVTPRPPRETRAELESPVAGPPTSPPLEDRDLLDRASKALFQGDYRQAALVTGDRLDLPAMAALHIRAMANLDAPQAERVCAEATSRHPLSAELYYLHAVLLLELGRDDEAARAAARVIYLDRSLAVAHFTLGAISLRRSDLAGARRAFRNVVQLAAGCPPDLALPLGDGERMGPLADAATAHIVQLDAALKSTQP